MWRRVRGFSVGGGAREGSWDHGFGVWGWRVGEDENEADFVHVWL